ncbi:hypothetical protein [Amycolatopsis rubida]|uniref:Multicopper oxidase n=1 Tax=Amycolatopsis rubida TaxID=112413 RepID=A0A1I5SK53_9PSEU|nr:hypothetical protein [Amycolatopsis rubida]SFP71072.1 Multicopper oxidase [Amycolatopsis rubida]
MRLIRRRSGHRGSRARSGLGRDPRTAQPRSRSATEQTSEAALNPAVRQAGPGTARQSCAVSARTLSTPAASTNTASSSRPRAGTTECSATQSWSTAPPSPAQRTRLRLRNASTARSYAFGFADDREFAMIASDGGLLAEPARLTRIMLAPGERAEIIVEMSVGETTTLRSYPQDLGLAESRSRNTGAADTFDVLLAKSAARLNRSPRLPDRLATIEDLGASSSAEVREFELGDNRIDEVVPVNTTEVWSVRNAHTSSRSSRSAAGFLRPSCPAGRTPSTCRRRSRRN